MRWSSLKDGFAWVLEVLSNGRLDEWGKTEHSTQRRTVIPSLLEEDLAEWRKTLEGSGHPTGALDFIIPGDLAGPEHGARDPRTGACHFSENQARAWGERFFTPAVEKAAEQPELFAILGATPYSLRRGGISLRLRAEDPQNRRQRGRHQPTHAQHPLRLRDRGPPPQRTTPCRHRVARRPHRASQAHGDSDTAGHARRRRRGPPLRQDPHLARRPQTRETEGVDAPRGMKKRHHPSEQRLGVGPQKLFGLAELEPRVALLCPLQHVRAHQRFSHVAEQGFQGLSGRRRTKDRAVDEDSRRE